MCNERGGVVDDLIVYRLDTDKYFIVVNAANRHKDVEWMKEHLIGDASMFLLAASLIGLAYYRKRGWIKKGGIKRIFVNSISMTMPSGIAVIGLVIMSKLMDGTGQTIVLANGIAGVLGRGLIRPEKLLAVPFFRIACPALFILKSEQIVRKGMFNARN